MSKTVSLKKVHYSLEVLSLLLLQEMLVLRHERRRTAGESKADESHPVSRSKPPSVPLSLSFFLSRRKGAAPLLQLPQIRNDMQ